MLKLVNEIIKYDSNKIRRDIDNYILYILGKKNIKNNIFYERKIDNIYDGILDLLDIYNKVKYKGSIYLLTNEIDNIKYLYSEILKLEKNKIIKLPLILKNILNENIKNSEINGKINVYKDVELIKLLFIKEGIINKEKFHDTDYTFKNIKKHIDFDFILNLTKLLSKDNTILEFLLGQNVTTLYNRTTYDYNEAIKRIKKDFLRKMTNFILENDIDINDKNNKEILNLIKKFNIDFGDKILKRYISDFIYYCYFLKKVPNIEIIHEINTLLLFKIENSFIEDFYIISENNSDLYSFIQQNLIIMFKFGVIGNFDEELYLLTNNKIDKTKLIDFFQYRIYL